MESLERLPNIVRLSERVVRVLGLNPSKFTLQGTNTYLIGKGPRKLLLDTGEGVPEYIPLLQSALDKDLAGATITQVVCSHWHHDHVGGIQDVIQFLASRNIHLHNNNNNNDDAPTTTTLSETRNTRVDEDTTLVTLHTPGHTSDHCSFYLKEENTLFTADCVLGQGTAVFEDLSSYIKSLEKQLAIVGGGGGGGVASFKIYPGHGPVIEDGPNKIREYIKHRLDREKQILGVLSLTTTPITSGTLESGSNNNNNDTNAPTVGGKTAMQIVSVIYEAYPASLHRAAEHQVLLHLKKLEQDGKVKRKGAANFTEEGEEVDMSDVVWEPVQQAQASL
ncbi:beta-lactamase-like protein [Dissophora ornata]|nr:beta-lactamase-like protein [Dissophora ornata]